MQNDKIKNINKTTNISSIITIIIFTIITIIAISIFSYAKQNSNMALNNLTNPNNWIVLTMFIIGIFAIPNIVFFFFQIIFWIVGLKNEDDTKKINHWLTSSTMALINSACLIVYFICFLSGNALYLIISLTFTIPLLLFYLKISLNLERLKRNTK